MSVDPAASSFDPTAESIEARVPPHEEHPAAYRRPGLVALAYAYRLAASLVLAAPLATLTNGIVADHPRGDAQLFDPGGLLLLEALRWSRRGVPAIATASIIAMLLALVVGLVPLAALIAGLGRRGRISASFLAERVVASASTLAVTWIGTLLAQAALAALVVVLGAKVIDVMHLAAPAEDVGRVVIVVLALVLVLVLGIVRDLAAVAAVNDGDGAFTAFSRAFRTALSAGRRVTWAYVWRGAMSLAAIGLAAVIVHSMNEKTSSPAALPFAVHQAAILLAVSLRASWLAAAMRLLDRFAPSHARALSRSLAPQGDA